MDGMVEMTRQLDRPSFLSNGSYVTSHLEFGTSNGTFEISMGLWVWHLKWKESLGTLLGLQP